MMLPRLSTLAQAEPSAPNPGRDYFRGIHENFSSDGLISPHWLLISVGVVLLLLSVLSIARWWRGRDQHSQRWFVFFNAARMVGIGWTDRWVLIRIARKQGLSSPLTLMLSPATFDHHVKCCLARCGAVGRQRLGRRTRAIRAVLFDDPPGSGAGSAALP